MERRGLVEELPARDLEQVEAQEQIMEATVATATAAVAVAVEVINFLGAEVDLVEELVRDFPAKAASPIRLFALAAQAQHSRAQ
jgi:hypothetical protein